MEIKKSATMMKAIIIEKGLFRKIRDLKFSDFKLNWVLVIYGFHRKKITYNELDMLENVIVVEELKISGKTKLSIIQLIKFENLAHYPQGSLILMLGKTLTIFKL